MRLSNFYPAFRTPVLILFVAAGYAFSMAAQSSGATYNVLRSFDAVTYNRNIGSVDPASDLVKGTDGNFYGTTYHGGANNNGTIYKLTPTGVLTTLHEFSALSNVTSDGQGTNADGAYPNMALVQGSDGNLYGATSGGGSRNGTIYKISSAGALTPLYKFDATDPAIGVSRLIQGRDGNLYGTSDYFSATGESNGVVFKFTPGGTLTILHGFTPTSVTGDDGADGAGPDALVQGNDGNFYGTTYSGGTYQGGTFYKLTPDGTLTTLYHFGASTQDSNGPSGALALGGDGNFYGTTAGGGVSSAGVVFRVTPDGTLTTLHDFGAASQSTNNADGRHPDGGLIRGSDGNFYGATVRGGSNNTGTIFVITPSGAFTVLHPFGALNNVDSHGDGTNSDGAYSFAVLAEGSSGVFYGVTTTGGANASGVIFQLAVNATHPAFFSGEVALGSDAFYLSFPGNGNIFGYYEYLSDPHYVYHFDLGFEYVFDAADGNGGVYFYDFTSQDYFYTSPTFSFPYLYDFNLKAFLYYYPDPTNPQRYNTNGKRYFYNFSTGKIISK